MDDLENSGDETALRKRIEKLELELRASRKQEARLRFLLDLAPSYIAFVGADRRFEINNAGYNAWLPSTDDHDHDGRPIQEVIGENAMATIEPHLEHVETGSEFMFYGPVQYQGQDLRHVRIDYRPMISQDGEYLGFGALVEDFTQRREEEERLRQAAVVFEAAHDAIVILNSEHKIVRVNQAFVELTGYSERDAAGQRAWNIAVPDRHELSKIWSAVQAHGVWQGEVWQRRNDGSVGRVWVHVNAVSDDNGFIHNYVAILNDLESKSTLSHLAHHDALTSLPNRLLLEARLQHTLERAARSQGKAAVLFMDLDGFKRINDSYGHDVGDLVLTEIARRLKTTVRAIDTVARLGGDEFVIILDQVADESDACDVAERVLDVMKTAINVNQDNHRVGVSIGISVYPFDASDSTMLLKRADVAMYAAKKAGKGQWATYLTELGDEKSYMLEETDQI